MAASQGRRKHCACLFRIRENCQIRKLKKNVYDTKATSTPTAGVRWSHFNQQPVPAAEGAGASAIYPEHMQQAPARPSVFSRNQSQEQDAMDLEVAQLPLPRVGVPRLSSAAVNNLQPNQHRLSPSASPTDGSMELDSGVDPETGERAQG